MANEVTNEGLDVEGSGDGRVPELLIGELQEVAGGVWLLPGLGNTTIILGSRGAAVVDPGLFINSLELGLLRDGFKQIVIGTQVPTQSIWLQAPRKHESSTWKGSSVWRKGTMQAPVWFQEQDNDGVTACSGDAIALDRGAFGTHRGCRCRCSRSGW